MPSDFSNAAPRLELPVNVGSLIVTGDRGTPPGILSLHPVKVWEGESRLTNDIARRVEPYGPALVFFFDLNVYPEETGFWVEGGAVTQFAVAPEHGHGLQMFVRNAAARNRIHLEIDGVEQALPLASREERTLPIQIGESRPGALIRVRTESGFRPSDVEQGSRDRRFLGVWIEFR
jgi:hypothetical protein